MSGKLTAASIILGVLQVDHFVPLIRAKTSAAPLLAHEFVIAHVHGLHCTGPLPEACAGRWIQTGMG